MHRPDTPCPSRWFRQSRESCQAFTLIELLAGMALLLIIVLFLSRVFADTTSAWQNSNKRMEANISGRTALEFMAREISSAIADGTLHLKLESDAVSVLGKQADRLYFLASDQVSRKKNSTYRQVKQVGFSVGAMTHPVTGADMPHRFAIRRTGVESLGSQYYLAYQKDDWWTTMDAIAFTEVIAENVRDLNFWVYDASGNSLANYDSTVDGPPAFIDIVVEMLSESDAIKIAAASSAAQREELADRAAHRYFTRVFFNNYQGYVIAP
ncbi:MAG: prepilin-type N-terminal cleavage/methylation domain-containing protein [Verrucomicrobia bacterium]|nr:prepilin-type N-terminal cleavage/methylation domain-containing protein [Verrucomicrobiota bacterium]